MARAFLWGINMKDDFIQALTINSVILENFIASMNSEEISNKIKDYWTIHKHLDHLVKSQEVILKRLQQFIEEDSPTMKPYKPANEVNSKLQDIQDLITKFKEIRSQQIDLIKRSGKQVWEKSGNHPQYKKYSFEILIRHAILHDGFHMWRMEELWIKNENLILELESN